MADPEPTVTVTLTPAQHRLLRDLIHWAAGDIQEGIDDSFWSYMVLPEDEDEAVATMQEIDAVLNPPESLAGGAARD